MSNTRDLTKTQPSTKTEFNVEELVYLRDRLRSDTPLHVVSGLDVYKAPIRHSIVKKVKKLLDEQLNFQNTQ